MTDFALTAARRALASYGCAPEELAALEAKPLRALLPRSGGFGLWGPPGTGKTWLAVQGLAEFHRLNRALWFAVNTPEEARPCWVHWPSAAEELKRQVVVSGSAPGLWVARAQRSALLVLDDLGRERVRGLDDYARSLLVEVVDHRVRHRLPVIWTSNLRPTQVDEFYRGALASRILGTWPPFEVDGDDMRLPSGGEV